MAESASRDERLHSGIPFPERGLRGWSIGHCGGHARDRAPGRSGPFWGGGTLFALTGPRPLRAAV